jgi:monoamine oxidase
MMAHTPLLRSLQRIALEHRLARARGLPREALPELHAAARGRAVSRRAFVAGLSAGAVTLGLPRRTPAADAPRIAIVGAGIAGLSCALELADRGVAATVYEASERVGGRMFSNTGYFDEGQVSEWCGELIDSDHLTVRGLAGRFGLTLDDLDEGGPAGAEETYFFDGVHYPKARANADFCPVHEVLHVEIGAVGPRTTYDALTPAARALDAMSVHDWIDSRVPGGHRAPLGRLLDVAYVIEFGADSRDLSALDLVTMLGATARPGPVWSAPRCPPLDLFGLSDERYHVRGGNQQIPEAIARSLGERVVRGHRLIRLRRTPAGRAELTFARGAGTIEITADLVVLALPFAVLRDLDWAEAGFDQRKARAINELGRAHNGKTQLQFTERIWNRDRPWLGTSNGSSYSDTGYQNTWDVSRAQPGRSGILVFYSGGPVTDAMRSSSAFGTIACAGVRDDARTALARAEPVFPGLYARWNGKATQSLPHLSDLRGASYSFHRVGQITAFGGYERARQGCVLFCGEHTSMDFQGHMEGGASEGVRAAGEILKLLPELPIPPPGPTDRAGESE